MDKPERPVFLGDSLIPRWEAPAGVQAVCGTRGGGVSVPPWDRMNLGDHVGDDPAAVAANRQAFANSLGARPVFLRQVHGTRVAVLDAQSPDGLEADACVTRARRVACTIMVADCLPVLLADLRGGVVAAAHAGWRGLAGEGGRGVLESVMAHLDPAHSVAWLGPCIGPSAFEVGPEVREAFEAGDPGSGACFHAAAHGKWLADLPALARRRLQALGVDAAHIGGNDGSPAWCTVTQQSRFFSHRRDRVSGRFAASVWLA